MNFVEEEGGLAMVAIHRFAEVVADRTIVGEVEGRMFVVA